MEQAATRAKTAPTQKTASTKAAAPRKSDAATDPVEDLPESVQPSAEGSADQWTNRRAAAQALRAAQARQVSGRRRFVDPTTCDRDYSTSELEFMRAMHEYKQRSGRMFPTWSEILEVLRALGYRKVAPRSRKK